LIIFRKYATIVKKKGSEGMNNQYNEEPKVNNDSSESDGEYAYKTVIKNKENRRTWSVVSLALGILSVLSLFVSWLSLTFGVLALGTGLFSRKNLGYFDGLSVAGIIIGIFGCVFAAAGMLLANIF
jgi:hypothetical protein